MHDLTGKIALVTGAASGIGLELAVGLAANGCQVVVGDIMDRARLDHAAATVGKGCLAVSMDVTDDDQVASAIAETQSSFG